MGWSDGGILAEKVWNEVRDLIPAGQKRMHAARQSIDLFMSFDCDTVEEAETLCKDAGRFYDEKEGQVVYMPPLDDQTTQNTWRIDLAPPGKYSVTCAGATLSELMLAFTPVTHAKTKRVYRYAIASTGKFTLTMPEGTIPLTVLQQGNTAWMSVLVDPYRPLCTRTFYAADGNCIPGVITRYLGTFPMQHTGSVFHLFEIEGQEGDIQQPSPVADDQPAQTTDPCQGCQQGGSVCHVCEHGGP
jgi:hypothetical protein